MTPMILSVPKKSDRYPDNKTGTIEAKLTSALRIPKYPAFPSALLLLCSLAYDKIIITPEKKPNNIRDMKLRSFTSALL
jgi:hypothetical protein